jgi:small subunit ribosomal protein S29
MGKLGRGNLWPYSMRLAMPYITAGSSFTFLMVLFFLSCHPHFLVKTDANDHLNAAKCVVDGQYSYEYCPRTGTYHQNSLSADILRKLTAVNDLEGLTNTKSRKLFGTKDDRTVDYEHEIPAGSPLTKLIQLGISQIHLAPNVLEIVFEELARQSLRPVFFAIDGAQNLFKPSDYVDGSFRQIDSFAFNVGRLLLNFARGTQKWVKTTPSDVGESN